MEDEKPLSPLTVTSVERNQLLEDHSLISNMTQSLEREERTRKVGIPMKARIKETEKMLISSISIWVN